MEQGEKTTNNPPTETVALSSPEADVKEGDVKVASPYRRWNEIRSATRALPVEILSTIFQLVCTSFPSFLCSGDFHRETSLELNTSYISALTLSAVSHWWREVAISTPKMWQTLNIRVENDQSERAELWANQLRLCIERSHSAMDLVLDFGSIAEIGSALRDMPHPRDTGIFLDQLEWLVFVEYPGAFKNLSLLGLDELRWSQLSFLLEPLSHLEELRVDCSWVYYLRASLEISNLRDVLSPRLTTLDLSSCPYDLSVELLLHCPNLTRCRSIISIQPHEESTWTYPIDHDHVLPRLEWLHWSAIKNRNTLRFATTSAPSLRYLKWAHHMPSPDDALVSGIDTAFIQFLSTATQLEELDIAIKNRYVALPARTLAFLPRIVDAAPVNVQKLTLHVTRRQLVTTPSPFITPLMGRHSAQSSSLTIPLPTLKALSLVLDEPGPMDRPSVQREDWIATNLITFLRQRWQLGLVHEFRLSFNFTCKKWDDKVYEGFRELIREGLRLEIDINDASVQWLQM
ncbi:hypothetical protein NP233_g2303 [Leucocoprinus birnbaumii]|uniref:F-box domain-containing protein n=1 Tax=Leucocoprinus birnbaumii TaxID=56174 RepID=A0AAD5VZ37_9AGAR|nr:hypothetical protein NP233_g2303 [Leucocoprinus birnbaumii]